MKKFTLFSVISCIVAALAFTSCNSDTSDSYQGLTKEQIQACFLATQGTHTGNMVYAAENKANIKDQTDTIQVGWTINTDSTMTIYNFPAKAIAEQIKYNDDLKAALAEQPNRNISCSIYYCVASPIQFLIVPHNVTYENVEYAGQSHKVEVVFYWNNYSFGQYVPTANKPMEMQIFAAKLLVDGNETSYGITTTAPARFYFYKEK